MGRQQLRINIRGHDDPGVHRIWRKIGESLGWTVNEQHAFDERAGKPVMTQVYTQSFDDAVKGRSAIDELEAAIADLSPVAIVMTPHPMTNA